MRRAVYLRSAEDAFSRPDICLPITSTLCLGLVACVSTLFLATFHEMAIFAAGGGGRNEVMLSQLATRSIYDVVSGFWTMMQQAIFSRGMEAMAITTTMLWSHFRKFCYRRIVIRKQNLLLFSAEMQMIVPRFSTGPNGDC